METFLEYNADCSTKDDTSLHHLCALPEDVLKKIVYQLDLKQAAMTALLCKGFRYIWHGIDDVIICDNSLGGLKSVNVVPKVRSFELLVTNKCSEEKLGSAMRWLLDKEVKNVVIISDDSGEIASYPTLLFNIESLVSLSLETPARATMPTSIRLGNLKTFCFNMRNYQSADLVNAVVNACPVLEAVYISIEGAALGKADIPCHLMLENSSLRRIQIKSSCTIGNGVAVRCEAQSLRFLSLVAWNILILPNKNFKELRVLIFLVTDFQHFQEFISILHSCDLLEELNLIFMVFDPRIKWHLDIGNKKLKKVRMEGGLYINQKKHLRINFQTPELNILHIDFSTTELDLVINGIDACKLASMHIRPTPSTTPSSEVEDD